MRKTASMNHAATRQDLLTAGACVFAARGFREATIREICRRARANVAAVNYHFGGKDGLYSEVLAEGQRLKRQQFAVPDGATSVAATDPAAELARFIRAMVTEMLTESPDSPHGQLMFREMIAPTAALDRVVAESIRPTAEELGRILERLLGPGIAGPERRLIGLSIVSQILNYKHCHAVITRLYPDLAVDASQSEVLADHITRFSLAALQGWRLSAPAAGIKTKALRKAPRLASADGTVASRSPRRVRRPNVSRV